MQDVQIEFETGATVRQCASRFQEAVRASYGGARRLFRAVSAIRDSTDPGGLEFFTPSASPFSGASPHPDWQAGVHIPGFSKMYGASRVTVHIYVVDKGDRRIVQLVGPYRTGDKGSTQRALQGIAARFQR